MGIFVNYLLLMLGMVADVFGISFYLRNRKYSRDISLYILAMGIFSGIWCICYGFIGITADFGVCELWRKVGVSGVDGFLIAEACLFSKIVLKNKNTIKIVRGMVAFSAVVDYCLFSKTGVDEFVRIGNWTTWYASKGFVLNRGYHSFFVALSFLILFTIGLVWIKTNALQREKRFIRMCFLANFLLIFFTLPDTFLPVMGYPSVPMSGIGSFACTAVIYYGATKLNSFDIRMGNIADRFLDFIDAGIIVFNTEKKMVIQNRYSERITNRNCDGGYGIFDIFHLEGITQEELFLRALETVYMRVKDRQCGRTYSMRFNALKDDYGEPFCYLCVYVDISEEMELIDKLKVASQAKSSFLAQMSHEIRTPINTVLGMNEMILRKAKDGEILEFAENIDSAGNTLLSLINSILDFSKIENGKMEVHPVRYDTSSLINDILNSVAQGAESKGLNFLHHIDRNIPCALVGDDVRIAQIISNLLSNAVKYTNEGSVTLSIGYEGMRENKAIITVSVEDTGIGIKEEDIAKLNVSFERLEEVRNRNIEGTGLGISIVTSLLGMMGSKLDVKSEYGVGSTFSFVLEQEVADATAIGDFDRRIEESHEPRKQVEVIHAPLAKVLVVDDNDMNIRVMKNLLGLCDIVPDTADSGEEALLLVQKNRYDVILLDHMMPGMDGVQTLHAMKEQKLVDEGVKVIALTANAISGAREAYLKEGFAEYLSKPVKIKDLVELLKKYLPEKAYEGHGVEPATMVFNCETNSLPAVPGVDWKQALENMPNQEKLLEIVKIFCETAKRDIAELEKYYTGALQGEEENLSSYRIKVHAMKNAAAQIGVRDLFAEAKALEVAAKRQEISYISENHAEYVKAYETIAEKLGEALFDGEAEEELSEEELQRTLEQLENAMNNYDTMALNEMMLELGNHTFSNSNVEKEVSKLEAAVRDFDRAAFEKAIQSIRQMVV